MNNSRKARAALLALVISFSLAGCSDNTELQANNKRAFEACLKTGGVPIQSWMNEEILGDCIYKHDGVKDD